jgi:hypothetical protein
MMSLCDACMARFWRHVAAPRRRLTDYIEGGSVFCFLLVVGQITAGLMCLATLFAVLAILISQPPAWLGFVILLGGVWQFFFCDALSVVFSRARSLARLAEQQAAENDRLWEAIRSLQSRDSSPKSPDTRFERHPE